MRHAGSVHLTTVAGVWGHFSPWFLSKLNTCIFLWEFGFQIAHVDAGTKNSPKVPV
jgi:hypothetical protein